MYPELIHLETSLGLVQINSYPFFLWTAIVFVSIALYRRFRTHRVSRRASFLMSAGLMALALVGGRLFHVVSNISLYRQYPDKIVSWDANGFSLYGAILLVGVSGLFIGRVSRIRIWKLADGMVPYIGISIVLARIGCFLNGCCFGKVTNLPWGVRFPMFSDAHIYQISHGQTNLLISLPVHPTQLYEAFGALVSVCIALWVRKKKKVDGSGMLVFVASFSIVRIAVHSVRVFPDSFLAVAPLFPALYIGIVCWCLFLLFRKTR